MEFSEDEASLLVIIIDCNLFQWKKTKLDFSKAIRQILIFINAYLTLKAENRIAIIGTSVDNCEYIYPGGRSESDETPILDIGNGMYQNIDDKILREIFSLVARTAIPMTNPKDSTKMSTGLSKALSYINKFSKEHITSKHQNRVLVVSVSNDDAKQYISIMNSIFAAQKMGVLIDVCKVMNGTSSFLEQAAEITGGTFVSEFPTEGFLQTLMFSFMADHYSRQFFMLPGKNDVDFRAVCFCHKKILDIGYVCSVCLSIFCSYVPVCSTCQTKFGLKLLTPPKDQC